MTGDIAKAITLSTYGTAFLKDDYDISGLTLDHPSFTFTNRVEFKLFKKHFFSKPGWHAYANSATEWLEKLKEANCKEIRLVFQPADPTMLGDQSVPAYKLAGFVGGGGLRYLETVFDGHSDFWQSHEEVTDQDAPDQKIWTVTYARTITGAKTQAKKLYDLELIKGRLKDKLIEISSFARKEDLSFWADWFDKALHALDAATPYDNKEDLQIVPSDRMGLTSLQLLAGAGKAWCFGGMSSWNDVGFDDKDTNELYEQLTAQLYDLVNESYMAVANSYA